MWPQHPAVAGAPPAVGGTRGLSARHSPRKQWQEACAVCHSSRVRPSTCASVPGVQTSAAPWGQDPSEWPPPVIAAQFSGSVVRFSFFLGYSSCTKGDSLYPSFPLPRPPRDGRNWPGHATLVVPCAFFAELQGVSLFGHMWLKSYQKKCWLLNGLYELFLLIRLAFMTPQHL